VLYLVPPGDPFEEARDDLEYFLGPGRLLAFPDPETLPYDASSPHPGITAQRMATLERLASGRVEGPAVVSPAGPCDSRGDHRIAMSLRILGTAAGVPVEVTDVDCIDTSFPGFQPLLEGLTR